MFAIQRLLWNVFEVILIDGGLCDVPVHNIWKVVASLLPQGFSGFYLAYRKDILRDRKFI